MSNSQDFSENSRFSGRRTMKIPEKSNFSHTCTLLSQYLKEKRSFGDLNLGMTCNVEAIPETFRQTVTTMNLFPKMEITGEALGVSNPNTTTSSQKMKSMDLFPQIAGFGPSVSIEEDSKKNDCRPAKTEPENAQMTIFYAGKVFVFNNFSSEKAKEIMLLASKASSQNNNGNSVPTSGDEQLNFGSFTTSTSNFLNTSGNNSLQPRISGIANADLPIARKASLHRFLEKRKDRVTSKAPYQVNNPAASLSKPEESNTWLGLASQSSSSPEASKI